jgi:hypothetical protein
MMLAIGDITSLILSDEGAAVQAVSVSLVTS